MVSSQSQDLGKLGEDKAVCLLKDNGYRIIFRNYKTKLGEIDIIALDNDTVCFIEVKTRKSDKCGLPLEAISVFKQRQISKVALVYLKEKRLLDKKSRFDVVSVLFLDDRPRIDLVKNAFELHNDFT
jgi:putative endonuclease